MKKRYVLKNRKRFTIFLSLVVLTTITIVFASTSYGYRETQYKSIVVNRGDTLWEIAAQTGDTRDVRQTVHDLKTVNCLKDSTLYAGMELKVPLY